MADLTITAANVIPATGATINHGTAGDTVTRGMPVYRDSADDELKPAQDTSTKYAAVGIALNDAGDGQSLSYISKGNLNPGATVAVGVVYVLSDTAGKIAVDADIGTGDYKTILGVATTTSNIKVDCSAALQAGAGMA